MTVSEGDKTITLNAGPKDGKEDLYYVNSSAGATVFSLSAGYFGDLNVDDTHFVKDAVPGAVPEKNLPQNAGGKSL